MTNEELREKFFAFLLKKACTEKQARDFLERQKAEDIDALMSEAEGMGLVDDLAYAKLFVEGHMSWGNMKTAHELAMRGISREVINAALDESDEEERARELAERWRSSGLEERKIIARLLSRGFSSRAVRELLE